MNRVTIKTIAAQAGVSTATVSMVMNGNDARISERTRQKVLSVAEELGYRPNAIARSLVTRRTKTVGLVIPDVANPFFAETARCIELALNAEAYNVFLCNTNNDCEKEKTYLAELLGRNIDGLILSSVNVESLGAQRFTVPTVIFDRSPRMPQFCSVGIADRAGGRLAARELIRRGHCRVACLSGYLSHSNIRERIAGFREALADAGVSLAPRRLFESDLTIQGGCEQARNIVPLVRSGEVTAVFCANDLLAFGVYKAFAAADIRIPGDVSIVGFDDIEFSRYLTPGLTTVAQPIAEIGKKAAALLLDLIDGKEIGEKNCVFPVHMKVRQSVAHIE